MNPIYARKVLNQVVPGEHVFTFEEDKDAIRDMAAVLKEVYEAGKSGAYSGPLPDGARRTWQGQELDMIYLQPLDVHVLRTKDGESFRHVAVHYRTSTSGAQRYDYGDWWDTLDAAVVEAISMKSDEYCHAGMYANKILGLE